jgi:hypothetical protein
MHDGDFCFWHSPEHTEEAAAARKLGGQRRRRESTLAGAFDVDGLDSVAGIRRVLEIVTFDGLGMEGNSVARGRLLIAAAQALTKLLEVGELEQRLEAVEATLKPPPGQDGRPAMSGEQRLDRLLPALSPQERAVLMLRDLKSEKPQDRQLLNTAPDRQTPELNRLIGLMNAANGDLAHLIAIIRERVRQEDLRFGWLAWARLCALEMWAVRARFYVCAREPVTESEYRKREQEARSEMLPGGRVRDDPHRGAPGLGRCGLRDR